jgi:hypothetical protein
MFRRQHFHHQPFRNFTTPFSSSSPSIFHLNAHQSSLNQSNNLLMNTSDIWLNDPLNTFGRTSEERSSSNEFDSDNDSAICVNIPFHENIRNLDTSMHLTPIESLHDLYTPKRDRFGGPRSQSLRPSRIPCLMTRSMSEASNKRNSLLSSVMSKSVFHSVYSSPEIKISDGSCEQLAFSPKTDPLDDANINDTKLVSNEKA